MQFAGEASDPAEGFVHQALIYGSDGDFVDVASPFIQEAVAADEAILVTVQERNVEKLRAALGGLPSGVTLFPLEQWYDTSARTRDKFGRWVAHQLDGGHNNRRRIDGRVRLIGEPPWAVGHDAQVRDWARYESVLNVAFAEYPVTFICAYDARVLPPEIIDHARSTHPEIVGPGGTWQSEAYVDPVAFCSLLDSSVDPPSGEPDVEISFSLADLPALRRRVAQLAAVAGLPRSRAEELVLAVNEIATNAVVHGASPAAVRVWREDGELIVEVSDAGEGIADALVGQLTPSPTGPGGRGIWLTRLVCDAVEIRNGTGCTVAMRAATPSFSFAA
jgi:anti-sigma regulatory factor (Ser/Thr protein kinase)